MVLRVKNVSVRYALDSYKNMRWEKKLLNKIKGEPIPSSFWALKKVSFKLDEGEVLGIIGKNGSGKTTLLKTIAGTINPQEGRVIRRNKVSALLELGTGFDRDLSVKENIYLRASLLGYPKKYLQRKYREIIEFAELEGFEEYSYANLSSGMKSRMAFAIVSIMEPEILVLDEVFSVGDGVFKQKSYDKMLELMHKGVSTILVSHSLGQVRSLCTRVIWLDHGVLIMDGDTETVCREYSRYLKSGKLPPVGDNKHIPGKGESR